MDLSRELARRVGVPLELIHYNAARKIVGSANDNVWDIGYLAVDMRRAEFIDFTTPHAELEGTYIVPADSPLHRIEDVDRDGVRIAVTANSAYDLFPSRDLKHAQIVRGEYAGIHRADARAGTRCSGRRQNGAREGSIAAARLPRAQRSFYDHPAGRRRAQGPANLKASPNKLSPTSSGP